MKYFRLLDAAGRILDLQVDRGEGQEPESPKLIIWLFGKMLEVVKVDTC